MGEKIKEVTFINQKLKESYESLKEGKFEDKKLYEFISRATKDLATNPMCGIHVPKRLIPNEYEVSHLWKYDLPNGWRLMYTIIGSEVKIVSAILEWLSHKEYERRFDY